MITTWKKMIEVGTDFNNEFKETVYNIKSNTPVKERSFECTELDKPIKIYTGQTLDLEFIDKGDEYYIYFGQGERFPEQKVGFAWLSDNNSIFFFERPYEERVLKLLKKLLPNEKVYYYKNDIYINGTKNGSSLRTGYQKQIKDNIENKEIKKSEPLSGMIYILRWDNLDGLNEAFKDIEHHQKRLHDKEPLSTLSDFLPNMTRKQFMEMLEGDSL